MMNSSRPAALMAARTPMPWSSSWFQIASICGLAESSCEVAASPPETVKSAATRGPTSRPQSDRASAKPSERSRDLPDDRVGVVAELFADVGAGADAHAVVVAQNGRAGGEGAGELPVDVDHRDARLHRLDGDLGQCRAVAGKQHDRVDPVVDEGLHRRDLRRDVVGALGDAQLHVVEALRGGEGAGVDGAEPPVVGCRTGEADDHRVAALGVLLGGRALVDDVLLFGSRAGAAGEKTDGGENRGAGEHQAGARLQV
jgi:hypothetical protein